MLRSLDDSLAIRTAFDAGPAQVVIVGTHAARRLLVDDDEAEPFMPVPWFWSDQYDRKIQMAGRIRLDDETHIATGSLEERRFAAIYGLAGRLVVVLGFNRPRHVMR